MTATEAHQILSHHSPLYPGKFFGASVKLSLGAGLIYETVRCPQFDLADRLFSTVESPAYVLTHECDLDPNNDRIFNEYVTICPLIPIDSFIAEFESQFDDPVSMRNFLVATARREVNRVVYIPPGPGPLGLGALLYLNNLASTHISEFAGANPLAAVSAYGLQSVDHALANHLQRPKVDRLSGGKLS